MNIVCTFIDGFYKLIHCKMYTVHAYRKNTDLLYKSDSIIIHYVI